MAHPADNAGQGDSLTWVQQNPAVARRRAGRSDVSWSRASSREEAVQLVRVRWPTCAQVWGVCGMDVRGGAHVTCGTRVWHVCVWHVVFAGDALHLGAYTRWCGTYS
jgi:hypothetical protein